MSTLSTNMGLTKWGSTADYFSHSELAANFDAIDSHDHTTGNGVQIPFGGLASLSVGSNELRTDAVITAKILDAAVTTAKLAANSITSGVIQDGTIAPVDLSTTTRSTFLQLLNVSAGTYLKANYGQATTTGFAQVTSNGPFQAEKSVTHGFTTTPLLVLALGHTMAIQVPSSALWLSNTGAHADTVAPTVAEVSRGSTSFTIRASVTGYVTNNSCTFDWFVIGT